MIVNLESDPNEPRGGGSTLGLGWHTVRIASAKEAKANTGNLGIEYTMVNGEGSIKRAFWLTPKAKYLLGNFAQCCGYKGKLREFDTNSIIGAQVQIEVVRGKPNAAGKVYNEVENFMPANVSTPHAPQDDDEQLPF